MADHDYNSHPWLVGFEKKNENQKFEVIIERLKYLESLVGTISVILLGSVCLFVVLMAMSVVTGKIDLGILTSFIK
jgi:hypothetical protein